MEKNVKPQNPSKVIITPKPPKKVEEKKTVKDTVSVKASIKTK